MDKCAGRMSGAGCKVFLPDGGGQVGGFTGIACSEGRDRQEALRNSKACACPVGIETGHLVDVDPQS